VWTTTEAADAELRALAAPACVFVHGAHHGGWCWSRVAEPLRRAGWRVYTPSLTGAGDRAHLLSPAVSLETRIADIVGLIEAEEIDEVIVCGHSAGGIVVTGVLECVPERISHVVYLDAMVPEDGQSMLDTLADTEGLPAMMRALAAEQGQGWRLPLGIFTAAAFGVTDAEDQEWVNRRMTEDSMLTFEQPLAVTGRGFASVRSRTYVRAEQFPIPSLDRIANAFSADPTWVVHCWDVGHDIMIETPGRVVDLLLGLAVRRAIG
jgi:pimeloyl-ACP methyl ester carboxylesterase